MKRNTKVIGGNWHVLFVDRAIALIFLAISVLAFGYWRAVACRYGVAFLISPGWWLRFVVSIIALVPIMLGDKLWTDLRDLMSPHCRHYLDYGEPWFPDREYRRYHAIALTQNANVEAAKADKTDEADELDENADDASAESGGEPIAGEIHDTVSGVQFAFSLAMLTSIIWAVAFAPLDDYNALLCYMVCIIAGLSLASFASIMALFEYIRATMKRR